VSSEKPIDRSSLVEWSTFRPHFSSIVLFWIAALEISSRMICKSNQIGG
jgi:hypothetical protein